MLVVPSGFGFAVFRFLLVSDPEEQVVTMGFDGSAGGPGQSIADGLKAAWLTGTSAANMSNEYTFVGVTVRYNEGGGPSALNVYESLSNTPGTFVSAMPPSNCAVLVRKLTATAGRRGKGRMYLPCFSVGEGNVDTRGAIATATRNNQQGFMNSFLAAFTGVVNPVLLHTQKEGAPAPPAPTPITSLVVADRIATRRLRMRP